jgi:hypothetical protein
MDWDAEDLIYATGNPDHHVIVWECIFYLAQYMEQNTEKNRNNMAPIPDRKPEVNPS